MAVALPTGPRGQVLAVAMLAAVLAAAWVVVAAPLLAWHADRAELLGQRQAMAERMERVAASVPQLQREAVGTVAAPEAVLLQGGSDAVAGAALQGQIEALALSAGIRPSSLELLPAEAVGTYRRVSLRVAMTGQWAAIVAVLQAVDGASPRMLVDDLQVQVAPSVTAGPAQPLGATFTVISFRAGAGP